MNILLYLNSNILVGTVSGATGSVGAIFAVVLWVCACVWLSLLGAKLKWCLGIPMVSAALRGVCVYRVRLLI